MRAVIYARYSTDLQSAASIDDQVRLCRERIERDGHELVQVYSDRAVSGATLMRPGIQSLMRDAEPERVSISSMQRHSIASAATRRMPPASSNACALPM